MGVFSDHSYHPPESHDDRMSFPQSQLRRGCACYKWCTGNGTSSPKSSTWRHVYRSKAQNRDSLRPVATVAAAKLVGNWSSDSNGRPSSYVIVYIHTMILSTFEPQWVYAYTVFGWRSRAPRLCTVLSVFVRVWGDAAPSTERMGPRAGW